MSDQYTDASEQHIRIRTVAIPRELGTPSSRPFEHAIEFMGAIEEESWGTRDMWLGPRASLPEWGRSAFERRTLLAAWQGDELVGCARVFFELGEHDRTALLWVGTAPHLRGRGLGNMLLEAAEQIAREAGRSILSGYTDHPQHRLNAYGENARRLAASVGASVIPERDPCAQFALRHNYSLAQVERVSVLQRQPGQAGLHGLQTTLAQAAQRTSERFDLVTWANETPEEYIDSFAAALSRMSIDAPTADLVVEPEVWNAKRVRELEREATAAGTALLRAIAIDRSDGSVAAYTELALPADHPNLAYQADTLVLAKHRGHGLGLLIKAANLLSLASVAPARQRVYTWNADENEHMLRINKDLGFELVGYMGSWQKTLE